MSLGRSAEDLQEKLKDSEHALKRLASQKNPCAAMESNIRSLQKLIRNIEIELHLTENEWPTGKLEQANGSSR